MTIVRGEVLICILALLVTLSHAATWTVTTNGDSGPGTLRDIVAGAATGDNIVFASSMTITLTTGAININKALYISGDVNGNGIADDVTISGNFKFQIFYVTAPTQTVTFYCLKLTRGATTLQGGAIYHYGSPSVAINRCYISHSFAGDNGGGVFTQRPPSGPTVAVSIVYTTFYNNTATNSGGGLAVMNAVARITSCLFRENKSYAGGAISHFQSGQTTVYDSTFSGKKAVPLSTGNYSKTSAFLFSHSNLCCFVCEDGGGLPRGGAIWGYGTSYFSINECTFSGNDTQGIGIGDATYTESQAKLDSRFDPRKSSDNQHLRYMSTNEELDISEDKALVDIGAYESPFAGQSG